MDYSHNIRGNDQDLVIFTSDGTARTVPGTHPRFDAIVELLHSGAGQDEVLHEVDLASRIGADMRQLSERVSFDGANIFFDGDRLDNALSRHIMRMVKEDDPSLSNVVRFMENLAQNPSAISKTQIWRWLEDRNFTITERGTFIAYKGVQATPDNLSVSCGSNVVFVDGVPHTGHIPNPVGAVVHMARTQVDGDREVGCSHGLHAGTYRYASGFGSKLLVVEINPRDVVSVPRDCQWQKLRTCRYTVLEQCRLPINSPSYSEPVFDDDDDDEDEEEDNDTCSGCGLAEQECECDEYDDSGH